MDKEYIERRALLKALSKNCRSWAHYIDAIFVAEKFPVTNDVVEVKHGSWSEIYYDADEDAFKSTCSVCDYESTEYKNYCPNCGAKMG